MNKYMSSKFYYPKRKFIYNLILIGIIFLSYQNNLQADETYKIKTVVIDAGHGGRDLGAPGKLSNEKDIVLAIALKLGSYINQYLPDVKVIYTRETDVFVELRERAKIANEASADLFISIHANSNPSPKPFGTETFVMGLHTSERNLDVAMTENSVILQEENYEQNYDGFDPTSPEAHIIFSLYQNAFLDQSVLLASKIQDQFRERARRHDRGVKQAGFVVLWRTTMPSILVETGFISNPKEEKYLISDQGQEYLASAIFRGFRDYKNHIEAKERKAATGSGNLENVQNKTLTSAKPETETLQKPSIDQKQELVDTSKIHFKIQLTSSSRQLSTSDKLFNGISYIMEFENNDMYKYAGGRFSSYLEASEYNKTIKTRFPDSFIIAIQNGKIIPVRKALKEIND